MPGTMSQADLLRDLEDMLQDAAEKFTGDNGRDFKRHLDLAALDMGRVRPRTLLGSITLEADKSDYAAPADLVAPKYPLWGVTQSRSRQPWQSNHPGWLPRLGLVESGGVKTLWLTPAPSAAQIADLGATYQYFYFAGHVVSVVAANTTVSSGDRGLLLLRATVQALEELAIKGINKPVSLGTNSVGSMPKNGTPAALAEQLMIQFEQMARA